MFCPQVIAIEDEENSIEADFFCTLHTNHPLSELLLIYFFLSLLGGQHPHSLTAAGLPGVKRGWRAPSASSVLKLRLGTRTNPSGTNPPTSHFEVWLLLWVRKEKDSTLRRSYVNVPNPGAAWRETGSRNRFWQNILSRKGLRFHIFSLCSGSHSQYKIHSEFPDLLNNYVKLKSVAKAPKIYNFGHFF